MKEQVQHTPGPWKMDLSCEIDPYPVINSASTQGYICRLGSLEVNPDLSAQRRANACLITAAPELLAELINAREVLVEQCGIESSCELIAAIDILIKNTR